MIGFYDTDHGLLVTLQALQQRSDERGLAIPDVYSSEPVAVVFVDRSLLWYKSETAKSENENGTVNGKAVCLKHLHSGSFL